MIFKGKYCLCIHYIVELLSAKHSFFFPSTATAVLISLYLREREKERACTFSNECSFLLSLTHKLKIIFHLVAPGSPHGLLLSKSRTIRMNFLLLRLHFPFLLSALAAVLSKHENLLGSHNP